MIEEVLKSGNYHLIDVREPMELEMDGNIEAAKNIPLGELEDRKEEVTSLDGNVILFCRSGRAVEYFKSLGLTNVYNGGGYSDLKEVLDNL
ncbi:rhodanese-like domain-containing protein [Riemerella anatipestifer]|uniref:rhodanese-like domain-containing protein n=1 Tax=Riemerella anatipestifer TaxID=34085 RepID=UPI00210A6771|nr:rhodanese-like domain-containing protein [Riemerella anatipestifer]MCQ4180486.1 rhodanese-like domain-containing protein [Riemerella anatipestifer]MDY3348637.1 rhodanese-like domain-containing protein [Riemerella anatipestifer]